MQLFAALFEALVDFDDFLGHLFVGVLGTADEREVRTGSDALVAVGVEAHAQHHRARFVFFAWHQSFALRTGTVIWRPLSLGPCLSRKGTAILAHSSGDFIAARK